MPRKAKTLILPNTYYHIYNRGINRQAIFRKPADYQRFLTLIDRYVLPVAKLLSYALMGNHFHLTVLMKPEDELPAKIQGKPMSLGNTFGHLQNAYARYFNLQENRVSGLFEQNYKRIPIDTLAYFKDLIVYHHLNPQIHEMTDDFSEYWWTSYQEYSNPLVERRVDIDLTLEKFGGKAAFFEAHRRDIPFPMQDYEFGV
ncbi:transposase [Neolewinella antarctica]|uniref:Transposase IS200-like domain-containing protein n=1 Tax=Neolewinella antarctica TaxID=442734 RepID=A0ABX0XFG5_9BACT|nr:transposase [Neolewinella antarctica]NJC28061.1 hypothetical protein [Neolewinella antarctica]